MLTNRGKFFVRLVHAILAIRGAVAGGQRGAKRRQRPRSRWMSPNGPEPVRRRASAGARSPMKLREPAGRVRVGEQRRAAGSLCAGCAWPPQWCGRCCSSRARAALLRLLFDHDLEVVERATLPLATITIRRGRQCPGAISLPQVRSAAPRLGFVRISRRLGFVRAHWVSGLLALSGSFGRGKARVRPDAMRKASGSPGSDRTARSARDGTCAEHGALALLGCSRESRTHSRLRGQCSGS
jgi:hypothetical protein